MNFKKIIIIITIVILLLLGIYIFISKNNYETNDISYNPNNKIEQINNEEATNMLNFLKSILV